MTSKTQIELSSYIKGVHQNLREQAIRIGPELAWENHCKNEKDLLKYAKSMHKLAAEHWDKNHESATITYCRIKWTKDFCSRYYLQGLLNVCRKKELEISEKILGDICILKNDFISDNKFSLLDVGSCYNPFENFLPFEITPIDISPANESVLKCDFLNVQTVAALKLQNTDTISELPLNYFHVVVFSLLLEYLPTPNQRMQICYKAFDVLKKEGILVIITPDSNHVGANKKIIKSWRHILARIGFSRIKYEKLKHLHCMVFRKCLMKEISQRWSVLHNRDDIFLEFVIPQDLNNVGKCVDGGKIDNTSYDNQLPIVDLFHELPYCNENDLK